MNSNKSNDFKTIKPYKNKNKNFNILKTNVNSPNISSIIIDKDLFKKKNLKLNNIFNTNNNNIINRSFDNRKYKKLKNKTPEISPISSTKNHKRNIIKYKYLNNINEKDKMSKNNKNQNYDCLTTKINKKENKSTYSFNNSFLNEKNKKYVKNKNISINYKSNNKKGNINIFNDYIKGLKIKENKKYLKNKLIGTNINSMVASKTKNKNNYITPLNNSFNNLANKKLKVKNNYININNNKTNNKSKINNNLNKNKPVNNNSIIKDKNNKNASKNQNGICKSLKLNKENNKKNNYFSSSIKNSLLLDEKLNIKVKFNNKFNLNKDKKNNENNQNNLNEKILSIISKSQQEILKIKEDFAKHFTNKNTPVKKKFVNSFIYKKNKNQLNKNHPLKINNCKLNLNKNLNTTNNKNNKDKLNENGEIKRINDLKNGLLIKEDNSEISNINIDKGLQNQNYYLNESIKLSNYIKDYYKNNKEYPKTDLNYYKYGRIIGQGAFGKVNIGLNVLTGRIVAIKSIDKFKLGSNSENMKRVLYENNLVKKLNHPNITKILEMFENDKYFLIIMEYINGGNLFNFVKKRRKLSEKTAKFLFRQIILGIQYMHNKNIVHRDIKLENILIDLNNNIKICDFGISLILNSFSDILYDKCGTPMYMAPEILLSNKNKNIGYNGPPVDIWSAGIALYIMLSGNVPFNITEIVNEKNGKEFNGNYSKNNILQYCIINKKPKKIDDISELANDLLQGLLVKNPKKRLNCEQILNHPWLYFDNNTYKYHLFTKAEMIMLSKTFIDYRYSKQEDLLENFTISNLKNDNNMINNEDYLIKNNESKSSIFTPYNSAINECITNKDNIYDDKINNEIKFENNNIIYSNKAKELNMIYELNNNEEIDNGILINSKTNSSYSNKFNTLKENYSNDNCIIKNINIKNANIKNNKEKLDIILEQIESLGYDKKYAIKIIQNNELSHIYAIYFLLDNYNKI